MSKAGTKKFRIFKGYRIVEPPTDFSGQAKDFSEFNNSAFQKFAKKNNITPETDIQVWDSFVHKTDK